MPERQDTDSIAWTVAGRRTIPRFKQRSGLRPREIDHHAGKHAPGGPAALAAQALLIDIANETWLQFARYTVVGGLAFLGDFWILFALTQFGRIHYLVSAAVAFVAGLLINYSLSAAWVFPHRTMQNRALEFGIFAAVGVIGLGLNETGMWLLAGRVGLHYLWAKIGVTGIVYIWNFSARKILLFR